MGGGGVRVERVDHLGIGVEDLAAAVDFFLALGLELEGKGSVEGADVDRLTGLEGVRADLAMLRIPDGPRLLELVQFHSPPAPQADDRAPANTPGMRHLAFVVEDIDASLAALEPHGAEIVGGPERFGDTYRLCYLRGPAGIIVELAEAVTAAGG
jgi:catechol 2,3-dioxygenase-like lactoylglutathione lyase family enzyme